MPGSSIVLNGTIGFPSNRQLLTAAGKMFSVTNPTLGTGVAYALKTGSSATANGFFNVQNNNPAGGANIILDRLRIIQTATAATGNLSSRFEFVGETGAVAMTTAVATITPVNMNLGFSNATGATVQFFSAGAATVPAAVGTRRNLGWTACTTGASILWDTLTLDFGADGAAPGTAQLTGAKATAAADYTCPAPSIVIAPGTSAWCNFYVVTQAANIPSYEYCLNYAEV